MSEGKTKSTHKQGKKKKKEEFDARGKELREKYKETKEINLETVY